METIFGEGWSMDYIIENGKLVGMKYHGTGKHMKEAFKKLDEKVSEVKKEMIKVA